MSPSPHLREALRLLLEAQEYADDLRCPLWHFALEIAALRERGLTNNDFRWLVYRDYLRHAPEAPLLAGPDGAPQSGRLALSEGSCFVLTPAGVAFARSLLVAEPEAHLPAPPPAPAALLPASAPPHWDRDRRELRFADQLVKRFKVPAPNQEIILAAFQEELWPACIDDPLPPHPSIDPKRRLHDTLGSLNRNQKRPLLRFLGNGNGEGVRWEAAAAEA
jgi:hypothetical protein